MKHTTFMRSLVSLGLGSLLAACSGAPSDGAGTEGSSADGTGTGAPAEPTSTSTPTPIASLTLDNGNTLEFYDLGDTALVMEAGKVGTGPVATNKNIDDLADTWMRFSKGAPVPRELSELGDRLMASAPAGAMSADTSEDPVTPEKVSSVAAQTVEKSPDGCNNGCCDVDVLTSQLGCGDLMGWGYAWFLPNIGSSTYNPKVVSYYGVVCSAVGQTQFSATANSRGGTWPVPEATWRSWSYTSPFSVFGGWDRKRVFTSTSGPLHAYCGRIIS